MKKALSLSFVMVTASLSLIASKEVALGKEYIEPLKYPKFSLTGEYGLWRKKKNFEESTQAQGMRDQYGYALSFETNLYKYLNAGVLFSGNIPSHKTDPLHLRLALFAKPFLSFGDRFDVFVRLGGGVGGMQVGAIVGADVHGIANIGIEFFPFSRLGLAFEYGLRGELIRAVSVEASMAGESSVAKYLLFYETPLALTMHIIL